MSQENFDPLAAYRQPSFRDRMSEGLADPQNRLHIVLLGALAVLTAALYAGYLRNPLVFDDYNLLDEANLKAIAEAPFAIAVRWLSNLSLVLTYRVAGTDWSWYRIGNLALHTTTVLLLYGFFHFLLRNLGPRLDGSSDNKWLAFFAALWFAVHPVAVYGVGYLIERSIVMATLFAVASLYCYVVALERQRLHWFLWALLCYFLALSSKEHAVMVPGAAIAVSIFLKKPALLEYRKHWLLAAVVLGMATALALLFASYQRGALGSAYEPQAFEIFSQMRERGTGASLDNAFILSMATQAHLFFKYLLLWIVPYTGWMSIDVRQPFATGIAVWPYAVSSVAFAAYPVVAAILIRRGGRRGLFGLGMIFPWLMFLPELSVVRVAEVFVLYRSYIWMFGVPFMGLALVAGRPLRNLVAGGTIFAVILALLATNRLDTLSDHIKLWTDAIEVNRGKIDQGAERPYFKRGLAYRDSGRYDEAIADFKAGYGVQSSSYSPANAGDKGLIYFQFNYLIETTEDLKRLKAFSEEIRQHPSSADAYLRRGKVYLNLLRPLPAANDFSEAIRLDPEHAGEALRSRALVLAKHGGPAGPAAAIQDLNRAIASNPRFAKAYMSRALVLVAQGNLTSALADIEKAVSLAPTDAEIQFNRGNLLVAGKRFEDAFRQYGKAIELDPNLADAYLNRAAILMQAGRLEEAMPDLDRAIALNPDGEAAYFNKAKIHLARGDKEGALSDFGKVLKLNHLDKDALFERGLLLAEKGLAKEARISLQRSCAAGNDAGCAKAQELAR